MPLISLREIRKTYTLGEVEVLALQGVSLDIGGLDRNFANC